MTIRLLILALLGTPLIGCVSFPKYVPLDAGTEKQVANTTAYMAVRQDEIIITAQSSNVSAAVGGGLIAAMIDSQVVASRQENIQKAVEPLYDSIDDVDFRKAYWTALEAQIRESKKLRISEFRTSTRVLAQQELKEIKLALKPNEAFMYVNTYYTFNTDYSALNILTGVDVWRGGEDLPIFSNSMEYISAPVGAGDVASIQKWSENSGKIYKEKLAEGIAETVKMARLEMEKPRYPAPEGTKPNWPTAIGKKSLSVVQVIDVAGEPLDERPDRMILRNDAGRLFSVPR